MLTSLTIVSFESSHADARVAINSIVARGTVLARIAAAFVNICYKKNITNTFIHWLAVSRLHTRCQTFRDTFPILLKSKIVLENPTV